MSIVRGPRKESNFYVLDKRIGEDSRLSFAARGLLIFLLCKPDDWRVSVEHLRRATQQTARPLGRDSIYNLLGELMKAGYMTRRQSTGQRGTFSQMEYVVSEEPQDIEQPPCQDDLPLTENQEPAPLPDSPYTASPYTAEPTLLSKQITKNTDLPSTQENTHASDEACRVPKGRNDYPPEFEAAWSMYPRRPGNSKSGAYSAWCKSLKRGATVQQMTEGVARYAAYCEAEKVEARYIKQAKTFFGPDECYLSDWTPVRKSAARWTPNEKFLQQDSEEITRRQNDRARELMERYGWTDADLEML